MTFKFTCAAVLALLAGCGEELVPATEFVAQKSDFSAYLGWKEIFLGDHPLPGHPPGPRYGHTRPPGACGAAAYPIGSIIVKVVEPPAPAVHQLFAMAKRGGSYNPGGAAGWEFFVLGPDATIHSRGIDPANPDAADGAGYANGLTCNFCHGLSGTERTDHVLSAALAPGKCP